MRLPSRDRELAFTIPLVGGIEQHFAAVDVGSAMAIVEAGRGSHFDPDIVDAFVAIQMTGSPA